MNAPARALVAAALLVAGVAHADNSVSARKPDGAKTGVDPTGGCVKLPPDATLAEIIAPTMRQNERPPTLARVLAWSSETDERPLDLDRALVWLAFGPKEFMLAHVYRHPRDSKTAWHLSKVYDVPYQSTAGFRAPPKRADLEDFLQGTWWHFEAEGGFKLLAAEVCAAAWKASFGVPPWHHYKR
jgi:hypothetical protein